MDALYLLCDCEVEFTFVPHLVERVFQQVVLVENTVELFEKLLLGDNCRSPLRIVQPLKCYCNLVFCQDQVFNCLCFGQTGAIALLPT